MIHLSLPRASEAHAQRIAELFDRHHGRLVRSLALQVRSWEEARDIASQAFMALLALERPGSVGFFGAYLYRTARNLATNHLMHRSMRRRKDPVATCEPASASSSPEPLLVEHQRLALLERVLGVLPAHWRLAVRLRCAEGLPYQEIRARFAGKGIELTERTLRRYVAAALEECRRQIAAAEEPPRSATAMQRRADDRPNLN